MDDAQAATWHGRVVRFGAAEATSGADTCRSPAYGYRTVPADSFLNAGFRISGSALGLLDSTSRVGLTQVSCGGANWAAPGGQLLWLTENRAYTVWDGVFFELRRQPAVLVSLRRGNVPVPHPTVGS